MPGSLHHNDCASRGMACIECMLDIYTVNSNSFLPTYSAAGRGVTYSMLHRVYTLRSTAAPDIYESWDGGQQPPVPPVAVGWSRAGLNCCMVQALC